MSRVIELQAKNFKRLQALRIHPDRHTVVVGGRNAQGKTSVLDVIWAVLGGGKAVPAEPIRRGKNKAEIGVKLDQVKTDELEFDGLVITRKFTHASSKLEVTTPDGSPIKSPQGVLDKLTGSLTFDPLAFCRQKPKGQAETLRQLAGLDTSDLDVALAKLVEQRKEANRDVKRLTGVVDSHERHAGVPDTLLVMADLLAELARRKAENDRIAGLEYHRDKLTREVQETRDEIENLQQQLVETETNLMRATNALEDVEREDVEDAEKQLRNAEQTNEKIRSNIAARVCQKELDAAEAKAETLNEDVDAHRGLRQERIEAADFPVEGLAIEDEGVTFNGIAFEQASGAEMIRVSASIGLAMNPELKVLLIRDGSLLDKESLAALAQVAEEHDAQIWIERVGDGDEVGVVIEDGEVVEDRTAAE